MGVVGLGREARKERFGSAVAMLRRTRRLIMQESVMISKEELS